MRQDRATLGRALRADPQDEGRRLELMRSLARAGGGDDLLVPLRSVEVWRQEVPALQDLTVAEVARRLGPAWQAMGLREWSCACRPRCRDCSPLDEQPCQTCAEGVNNRTITYRLGLFRHRQTGMEFSLIPAAAEERCGCGRVRGVGAVGRAEHWCSRCDSYQGWLRTAPFLIGRHLVSHEHLKTVAEWSPHVDPLSPDHLPFPIRGASHALASGTLQGLGMRLASIEEWMHAAAGGAPTRFYWGDEVDDAHVWHQDNVAEYSSHCPCGQAADHPWDGSHDGVPAVDIGPMPVTAHDRDGSRSAFGLVDMVGNLAEHLRDRRAVGPCFMNSREACDESLEPLVVKPPPTAMGFRAAVSVPPEEA